MPKRLRRSTGQRIQRIIEGSIVGALVVAILMIVPDAPVVPDWAR